MPLLDKYSAPLTAKAAEHLLRRTMFGASRTDITALTGKTIDQALDTLLKDQPAPPPPTIPGQSTTWIGNTSRSQAEGEYNNHTKAWWISRMANESLSITEKMTVFWHNHFVSTFGAVNDTRYLYKQHQTLRRNVLGNFKTFVREITIDPAMLVYLNGNRNVAGAPQENYARELQELFTIGKGPEISQGNYTTYTEDDVKAAARVLTGWIDVNDTVTSRFRPALHDNKNKQFSAAYQNTIITGRTGTTEADGLAEIDDMLTMIFKQNATSEYIVSKFYRFFVNSNITPAITNEFIKPLAKIFRDSGYEIKPVLRALFGSIHFFDEKIVGCMIKTPLDLIVGAFRSTKSPMYTIPVPTTLQTLLNEYNTFWYGSSNTGGVLQTLAVLQQDIFGLPNVAGWQAYYQEPLFYQTWINTATMPLRGKFTDYFVKGWRLSRDTVFMPFDSVKFLESLPTPRFATADIVVENFTEHFYAIDLTDDQKDYLVHTILMSNPKSSSVWTDNRYIWSEEWNAYLLTPLDPIKKNTVKARLDALLIYMMKIAEYQIM